MRDETHPLELLPAYALSALDDDEAALVAAHLTGCPACRAELQAFHELAGDLALIAPEATPSPHVRRRLLARVAPSAGAASHGQTRPSRRSFAPRLLPLWGALSLVLILALAAVTLSLWQRVNQLESTGGSGRMYAIPLTHTDAAPAASGMVVISPDGRNGVIVVDGLPLLDTGQEYQLWLTRNGQRISGALFTVDEDGYAGRRIVAPDSLLEYTAVGITIEPAGGSPAPTGDRVLGGPLLSEAHQDQP
jgi:anti-sigma-K factor RskA